MQAVSDTRIRSAAAPVEARQSSAVKNVVTCRRTTAAALVGLALGMMGVKPVMADGQNSSPESSSSGSTTFAITITKADPSFKKYMEDRDKAMENQCPGGMFDCDGDRRDFAKQQWKDFLDSGGVPKRVREGKTGGPRSY